MSRRWLVLGVFLLALAPASARADVVTDWNEEAIATIGATRTFVVPGSRALAMMHLAMYDAISNITGDAAPYQVIRTAQTDLSPEAAAAAAAHRVLVFVFPARTAQLNARLVRSLAAVPPSPARARAVTYGNAVADAILAWRAQDHAEQTFTYVGVDRPGHWQPTPPAFGPPIYLQWEEVTPFAMTRGSQFRPPPPPALTSPEYAAAVNEVKALGAKDSTVRTPEQTQIAHFWADPVGTATTVGRWNQIAQQVAARRGYTRAQHARLFALLNTALADAAIVAWDCKLTADFWRPVTALRQADRDDNPGTAPDPTWEPLIPTPSFPEYVSGHATFSGAAAVILAHEFGDENSFAVTSYQPPTVVRHYTSFSQAAREGTMSRLYGGIHYRFSCLEGLRCGQELGEYVWSHYFRPEPTGAVIARR